MLISIKTVDELGDEMYARVNPFHIVRITIANPKNPDAGSYILLRTGEEMFSADPIDIIDSRYNNVVTSMTAQMMIQIINEYAESVKPKRGRPRSSK